jgi:hypothetical protein
MTIRYHRSYKYRVWQGFTGLWWWALVDFPRNHPIDGKANTKREAARAARDMIDKCI